MISLFFQHLTSIFVESAPWLLLGFFIAGIINALISTDFLHRHLGGNSTKSVIKGALIGAPLPLCSCGVIPAALGIRRSGGSKASTTAFLIATPETGVDSISVTYALLGPMMAIVRPIAAITTAIVAGLSVMKWGEPTTKQRDKNADLESGASHSHPAEVASTETSCCITQKKEIATSASSCGNETPQLPKTEGTKSNASSCCGSEKTEPEPEQIPSSETQSKVNIFVVKLKAVLKFTFIDLIKDTSLWLLIGFVMAAVIMMVIPTSFLQEWGSTPYAYIIMAAIGVPTYICATASTPIAASLLFSGVSPGAVLVFMLVGPATNVATIAAIKSELGARVLTIYLSSVIVVSFLFGWLVDATQSFFSVNAVHQHLHSHGEESLLSIVCAVVLAILLINALWKKFV